MTENTIQVVAMVVDSGIITFYKTDGSVYTITQGDPRGPDMSESFLLQRQQGKEVIELRLVPDDKVVALLNSKNRNPLIKFFRARIDDVKKFFGAEIDHTQEGAEASHEAAAKRVREVAAKLHSATTSSEAQAVEELPITLVTSESPLAKDETIIAVTADGIIPEVESLTDQFKASDSGEASATGPDNLILRLAKMSAKRGHTAQELIRFIKGIDLPILPDGSFLAYKRLLHRGNGVYVDPHSKKVHQRIGDIVQMDEKLVDTNRRTLCSTGLHVGTRTYMGGFHGNAEGSGTMLVLVQPEDAIAVPQNEATKGRMVRYLILADLSNKAHDLVNQNKRMDDCKETMQIVAQIVAGARPPLLGVVNISAEYGGGLSYTINGVSHPTDISLHDARVAANTMATAPQSTVKPVRTIDDKGQGNRALLEPSKVRTKEAVVKPTETKAKIAAQAPVAGASERTKKASELYARMTDKANTDSDRRAAAQDLKTFKQKAKVGYPVLGLPADTNDEIQEILVIVAPSPQQRAADGMKPSQPQPAKETPVATAAKKAEPAKTAPKAVPAKKPDPAPQAVRAPAPQNETRQAKARRLYGDAVDKRLAASDRKWAANELQKLKKASKVSWSALGLGNFDVEKTLKQTLG